MKISDLFFVDLGAGLVLKNFNFFIHIFTYLLLFAIYLL